MTPKLDWRMRLGRLAQPAIHRYRQLVRGLTLGVRAAVIDQAGRVLLVKHSYVPGWYLPGGGVEPGESALDALTRELKEEGNVELEGAPELFGFYFNTKESRRDHIAFYVVRRWRQPAPPQPGLEIVAHCFAAPDALPDDATAATRRRCAEIFAGVPRATRW
ncbi:MAG: NUDIX domain-containing protein [Pseudomonadota bacterium]|nr:NUDIX domain-containing protein [Pseudomonadota bacterium]